MMEALKVLAVRQRTRVNNVVVDAIRQHLAAHGISSE